MVGVHHLGKNTHMGDTVFQAIGHDMVVDAPAKVLGSRACTEAPPAVLVGLLHQLAEAVDIAVAEKIRHPLPLLRQEA